MVELKIQQEYDAYFDAEITDDSEEKREETEYGYKKGYLSVDRAHKSSITNTTDTPITPITPNEDADKSDLETEFMEDDEHAATMLKLYHPIKKRNKRNNYSKTDKSISPELLRISDSTEPPSFIVRPHIIDNESRISTSFNFDNIDKVDEVDEIDEVDTASDRFATGFIGDDDDDNESKKKSMKSYGKYIKHITISRTNSEGSITNISDIDTDDINDSYQGRTVTIIRRNHDKDNENIDKLIPEPRYLSISVSEDTEYHYIKQPRASKVEKMEFVEFNKNKVKQPKSKLKNKSSQKTKRKKKYLSQNGSRASKKVIKKRKKYAPKHHYNHYSPKHQQYTYCNDNDLADICDHFWRVIDIASNKRIPFEILKISLRVKSIDINENNWDILLNQLTNYQPSKNITLKMFKDFLFNKNNDNTCYIVNTLRRQLIVGLIETDDRDKSKIKGKTNERRARSSSHHSYLQSMRSSITSHENASEYVKYTVQQSIINSLLECYQNGSLHKLNGSRMHKYSNRNEWRKSLKYLLRCHFAYISENQDVFTLEQFKFALYDECNIRYQFSHHILPILKLNTDDFKQQYVITEHSFVDWMIKHIDQLMNLRNTQSVKDRHLDKLLKIISYKKKRKITIQHNNDNKLRLLKAKSMNAMPCNDDIATPTTNTTITTTTTNSSPSTIHIRRPYKRKDDTDNNHLRLQHPTSRHHYSTSHGVPPNESKYRFMYHYK